MGDGPQVKNVDPEEHHERDEVDIEALIRKIELSRRAAQGDELGTPGRPGSGTRSGKLRLSRLTEHKNKSGEVTSVLAFDDITGMKLDAGKVIESRTKEVTYLRDKRVYDKTPRDQALKCKWKIIRTRWIDINKGDDENPVYRSRLVGKEFNDGQMDGLFAATTPLEALRFIVHEAATVRSNEELGSKVIMINDVARVSSKGPR